jgi:hypothetical protein
MRLSVFSIVAFVIVVVSLGIRIAADGHFTTLTTTSLVAAKALTCELSSAVLPGCASAQLNTISLVKTHSKTEPMIDELAERFPKLILQATADAAPLITAMPLSELPKCSLPGACLEAFLLLKLEMAGVGTRRMPCAL